MVIYIDGGYSKNSLYPDTMFDEKGEYVIPDYSELSDKYIDYLNQGLNPKVITNSLKEVVDVIPDKKQEEYHIKQDKITDLESKLANSDYKIIKCYEASIKGAEMPYDIDALIKERDEMRAEINKLQKEIN